MDIIEIVSLLSLSHGGILFVITKIESRKKSITSHHQFGHYDFPNFKRVKSSVTVNI